MTGFGTAVVIVLLFAVMLGSAVLAHFERRDLVEEIDRLAEQNDLLVSENDALWDQAARWKRRAHEERARARRLAAILDAERVARAEAARRGVS